MANKAYRPTKEDAAGLNLLIEMDERVKKGQSQALYYAFKDTAKDIKDGTFDWKEVSRCRFFDDKLDGISKCDYAITKSFTVDDCDWDVVVNSYMEYFCVEKVSNVKLARLMVYAARMRMITTVRKDEKNDMLADYAIGGENPIVIETTKPDDSRKNQLLSSILLRALQLIDNGEFGKIEEFLK